jgi:mandelate racemase
MRIRSVEARAVVAPLEPPIRTASGHVTQAPILLIDLTTDEDVVGRAYLFGYHAFTLGLLRELVITLGDSIKGDVVAPVDLDKKLRARMALFGTRGLQGMAVAGLDMAAWDALAVAAGVPLVTLLGGRPRPIAAYNSLGMIPPAEAADAASRSPRDSSLEGQDRLADARGGSARRDADVPLHRIPRCRGARAR